MTTMKKRSEIAPENTWDLNLMYHTIDQWEADFKKVQELLPNAISFQGRMGESAQVFLDAMRATEELGLIFENVYTYANMKSHEDTANTTYQALSDRATSLAAHVSGALSFIKPEILGLPEATIRQFLQEHEELAGYEMHIDRMLREKEHVLSPEQEQLLALTTEMADAPSTIFSMLTNADMDFGKVTDDAGQDYDVSEGTYRTLMESSDRTLRERAFKQLFGTYGKFRNTIASSYSASVKSDVFYARVKKYESALAMALAPDNVKEEVYNNLIQAVHDNMDTMHRYVALRKKIMGLDDLHYYDLFTPLVDAVQMKMPFDKARDMSITALAPLGEDYVNTVRASFDERWIDVYPNQGKRSGAYSWGTYTSKPYILLNHNDTLDSLFTLVHELGHSLHSYYTHKHQPYVYGNYTIFVAEVASTLNENLLLEKMLAETTDKKERMYLLNHSLDQFRSTVFRQTMFAEFEKIVHEMVERGESLTADNMSDIYGELNERYYGPELVIDDELKNEWARIPHFYNAFYVYKYATGFAAAMALSQQILTEGTPAVERYLQFLSNGSSLDPIDLLKGAGVDMSSPEPITASLSVFKQRLEELESLLNEV